MKAVLMSGLGGIEFLHIAEHPEPVMKEDELLVRIRATSLNRADLLQRRGKHLPPKGVPDILGLEMAGEVASAGAACEGWAPGDRVCALLPGGGYAELVAIPAGLAMRIPESLSFEQAAAIPEVFLTAYQNLFNVARLRSGDTVLIHAGGSGVGTAAIQLVREAGGISLVTAGSTEKIATVRGAGRDRRVELQGRAVRPLGRGTDRGARGRHRPGFHRGAVFRAEPGGPRGRRKDGRHRNAWRGRCREVLPADAHVEAAADCRGGAPLDGHGAEDHAHPRLLGVRPPPVRRWEARADRRFRLRLEGCRRRPPADGVERQYREDRPAGDRVRADRSGGAATAS